MLCQTNSATAFTIKQGSDAYLIIDTANSSESVSIGTGISGTAITLGHGTSEVTVADNLTVTGNLTVSGDTTTVSTSNMVVADNLIELNNGATSNSNDSGIVIERGSTGDNAIFMWDESADTFVLGTTTATGSSTGNLSVTDGALQAGSLDISGNIDVDGTSNLDVVDIDGAVDMASTLNVTGKITADAGIDIDNFNIDGTTIALSSGDMTLDAAGDIILDADGAQVRLKDAGTERFVFNLDATPELDVAGGNFTIHQTTSDADIIFTGNDGGAAITALTLDMSAAGAATFNDKITAVGTSVFTNLDISGDVDVDGTLETDALTVGGVAAKVAGKETIWIPSSAMQPTTSNGCSALTTVETTSGRPDMVVLDFDKDSDEFAQFSIAFPKSWNEGTVTFQYFWSGLAATTGVVMKLDGVAVDNNGTIDVAYGTAVSLLDDAQGAVEELNVSAESNAVTIAGSPAVDNLCFFRIGRNVGDGNDDMAGDCRLHGIKLFFTTDAANDA